MNFHVVKVREAEEDLRRENADLKRRLDIAHRIMASQGTVIGQAHAALMLSKEALRWYGGEHFEGEDGIQVNDRINDTLVEILS